MMKSITAAGYPTTRINIIKKKKFGFQKNKATSEMATKQTITKIHQTLCSLLNNRMMPIKKGSNTQKP